MAQEASRSPQDAGEKSCCAERGGNAEKVAEMAAAGGDAGGSFCSCCCGPHRSRSLRRIPNCLRAGRREWEAEQQAKKAEIQAMRDAGLPYVGMPESEIGTTPVLGSYGVNQHKQVYQTSWDGGRQVLEQSTYLWFTTGRKCIFTAICLNGYVSEVQEESGYWQDHTSWCPSSSRTPMRRIITTTMTTAEPARRIRQPGGPLRGEPG